MADEKKFLDQAGVQYLWSQLSLHDYPNNETLVAVINAIDETKADAEHTHAIADITDIPEQVQADWNENDTESPAYISNRPFYTGSPVETILLDNHTGTYEYDSNAGAAVLSETTVSAFGLFVIGEAYNVVLDGTLYNDLVAFYDGSSPTIGSAYGSLTNDLPFCICTYENGDEVVMIAAVLSEATSHTFSISQTSIEIRKLEMKYLPDGYPYDYVGDLVIYNGTPWVDYDSETGTRYTTIYLSQNINLYEHSSLLCEVDGYTYTISPTEDNIDIWGNAYLVDKTLTETEEPPIALDISGCESGTVIFYSPLASEHELKITVEGEFEQSKIIDERFLPKLIGAAGTGVGAEVFNSYDEGDDISTFAVPPSYFQAFNVATGDYSHAEGRRTTASGLSSHAEGEGTIASGSYSHAEGCGAEANGHESHAEGYNAVSNGSSSHAEGYYSEANGDYSHAEGYKTTASGEAQHVQGKCNITDENNVYAHIVGNGTGAYDSTTKTYDYSNAHTLDWNGNAWFAGDVYTGGTSQSDATKVSLEGHIHAITDITDITATTVEINHLSGVTSNVQTQITDLSNELDNYYLKTEADVLHQEMEDYVDTEVAALVGAAPETLDTIGELAAAFEQNQTVIEALDASITNKQNKISDTLILVDTVTGIQHKIQIQDGQLVSFPVE